MSHSKRALRRLSIAIALGLAVRTASAQVVRQLTHHTGGSYQLGLGALDDAGTIVYAAANEDPLGTNPRRVSQVFHWDAANGVVGQVLHPSEGVSGVSVSDDGQWLAFVSRADLIGQNHDESPELYVMRSNGTQLAQLTNDPALNAGDVVAAQISGSGNRVAFTANTNPLGANSSRRVQLFVINRDGTGLAQLTPQTSTNPVLSFSISDDGQRLVYVRSALFRINADGTDLEQLASGGTPMISGNGAKIVYATGSGVSVIDWAGAGLLLLDAAGRSGSITDDAQSVYYHARDTGSGANDEIWRIRTDGTGKTRLTTTTAPLQNRDPVVAGGGSRVAFSVSGGAYSGFSNPDLQSELMVMDSAGGTLLQLTDLPLSARLSDGSQTTDLDLTPDGARVVFWSNADLVGLDPANDGAIYRLQADGSGLAQIVDLGSAGAFVDGLSIASDGSRIAFGAWEDLTGQNTMGCEQLFGIAADGSNTLQLTPPASTIAVDPVIPQDASFAVFQYAVASSGQLYRVNLDGTGFQSLATDTSTVFKKPRASAQGEWIVYQSPTNADGQNPDGGTEVFRYGTIGGPQRLTAGTGVGSTPDISADGGWIVYISNKDPLGTNPDHGQELFVLEPATASLRQLTTLGAADGLKLPRISRDGAFVAFTSNAPIFDDLAARPWQPYRVHVDTGAIERLSGPQTGGRFVDDGIAIDGAGSGIVWVSQHDPLGENGDGDAELYFVDFDTPARIVVGPGTPTVVSWDVEPSPVRYDVIRGDVANLALGAGNTVDLGSVVCIEDDSPDADTIGDEDVAAPSPGQVFFYAYRGSPGLVAGPGSYGQGSGGRERVPAGGGCAP